MADIVWLRGDSWPWPRLARLMTASDVDRPSGLMRPYRGSFSIAENDPAIAEIKRGRMVEIASTDGLEPWIGWIDRPRYDLGSARITVDCVDVPTKLMERHSGFTSPLGGVAGWIARDLLYEANCRNAFGLVWDITSVTGTPVSECDVSNMSVLDALTKLVEMSGDEWGIRVDITADSLAFYLRWTHRWGFDRSQQVYLRQGYEISALSYTRASIEEAESVAIIGSGGQTVIRATANPERAAETGAVVQPASLAHRRAVSLTPALAAERVELMAREGAFDTLSHAAEMRLEGELSTSEELEFTVSSRADWSLLRPGNTVTVIYDDPTWGTSQRAVRIWEISPAASRGELRVQCFRQQWGLLSKLREHDRAIRELETA